MMQKKIGLGKYLCYHSECNITMSNSMLTVRLNWHKVRPVSCTMLYSKLYIVTELNVNDLNLYQLIDRS